MTYGLAVIGEAGTGREAHASSIALRPDVVVMDIQMPELDGIEATTLIRRDCPATRVLILTTFEGDARALRAIKAGASGYLLKNMAGDKLPQVIRDVHAGQRYVVPPVAVAIATHLHCDALSNRETQVLDLVSMGRSNRLIGAQLGISEQTVKVHMKSILAKMCASDRTQAVMIALERGILDFRTRCR